MTIDELAAHYSVPRSELAYANPMILEALTYAAKHDIKIRRTGKCWEVRDPVNPGNIVKIADCWLTKGEIPRLRKRQY